MHIWLSEREKDPNSLVCHVHICGRGVVARGLEPGQIPEGPRYRDHTDQTFQGDPVSATVRYDVNMAEPETPSGSKDAEMSSRMRRDEQRTNYRILAEAWLAPCCCLLDGVWFVLTNFFFTLCEHD